MHRPDSIRQQLAAEKNHSAQLEETVTNLREEKHQLQVELDSKSAELSREVSKGRGLGIALGILLAIPGWGVFSMPLMIRVPCCLLSWACVIWIIYSLS